MCDFVCDTEWVTEWNSNDNHMRLNTQEYVNGFDFGKNEHWN